MGTQKKTEFEFWVESWVNELSKMSYSTHLLAEFLVEYWVETQNIEKVWIRFVSVFKLHLNLYLTKNSMALVL